MVRGSCYKCDARGCDTIILKHQERYSLLSRDIDFCYDCYAKASFHASSNNNDAKLVCSLNDNLSCAEVKTMKREEAVEVEVESWEKEQVQVGPDVVDEDDEEAELQRALALSLASTPDMNNDVEAVEVVANSNLTNTNITHFFLKKLSECLLDELWVLVGMRSQTMLEMGACYKNQGLYDADEYNAEMVELELTLAQMLKKIRNLTTLLVGLGRRESVIGGIVERLTGGGCYKVDVDLLQFYLRRLLDFLAPDGSTVDQDFLKTLRNFKMQNCCFKLLQQSLKQKLKLQKRKAEREPEVAEIVPTDRISHNAGNSKLTSLRTWRDVSAEIDDAVVYSRGRVRGGGDIVMTSIKPRGGEVSKSDQNLETSENTVMGKVLYGDAVDNLMHTIMQLSLALVSEDWNSVEWRMLVNEVIQSGGRGKLIGKHLLKKLLGGDLDEYHRVKNNFVLETSLKNVTRTTRGVLLEAHKVLKKAALSSGVETSNNWAAYVGIENLISEDALSIQDALVLGTELDKLNLFLNLGKDKERRRNCFKVIACREDGNLISNLLRVAISISGSLQKERLFSICVLASKLPGVTPFGLKRFALYYVGGVGGNTFELRQLGVVIFTKCYESFDRGGKAWIQRELTNFVSFILSGVGGGGNFVCLELLKIVACISV